MAKLEPRSDRMVFAPLIWRLAMKIEQVPWSEVAGSVTDAVYVLRSAQRLFKQDIHCVWFDTWLEAEAAGLQVERDELGRSGRNACADRGLAFGRNDSGSRTGRTRRGGFAASRTGSRSRHRPGGDNDRGGDIAKASRRGTGSAAADSLDYVRQILLGLTRLYCEAGAGAIVLLDEEPGDNSPELTEFGSLFNLAEYFATPVFVLSREQALPAAVAAANSLGAKYLTPDQSSDGIVALPPNGDSNAGGGWIAISRWEIDPETDPNTVQSWRQKLVRN